MTKQSHCNDISTLNPEEPKHFSFKICALDADDGTVIWKNDTIGDHSHELDYGGISPQSYLVASEDILYVPSGRAMPG